MSGGESVVIHRRVVSGQDVYHNDVLTDVDESVLALAFDPGSSSEVNQGRDSITTQPTVHLFPGTLVDGLSAVTARSVRYEVDGTPEVWVSPFSGWAPGIEVRLRAVSG